MKPETRIPDSVIMISNRYRIPIIVDPFWSKFILLNDFRLFGKVFASVENDIYANYITDCFNTARILVYFNNRFYYKFRDLRKRRYGEIVLHDSRTIKPKITKNTLILKNTKMSYMKAKLKL